MKSEDKKGFTLTELIAVIVIVSILGLIASVSYLSFRDNILEKDYQNLVSYIETKASLYAANTGITYVNIKTLIENGYLEADDETGNLYNPKTKESMNCQYVSMIPNNGSYEAKLDDENNDCNVNYEEIDPIIMGCELNGTNCKELENGAWLTNNILIKVVDSNKNPLPDNTLYNWYSNIGHHNTDPTINTEFSTNSINKITYLVNVTFNQNNKKVKGSTTISLNYDNAKPIITSITIENENTWTDSKRIIINTYDASGVGISTYYLGKNSDCSLNEVLSSKSALITENGTYYACIKDNNNFYSATKNFTINKIDAVAPTINFTEGDTITLPVGTNKPLSDYVEVTDKDSKFKNLEITVNNNPLTNANELEADPIYNEKIYFIVYKAYDNAQNSSQKTLTLKIIKSI